MKLFSDREQIVEVVHRLFVYTDNQQWEKLRDEVFTGQILFDMASAGGIKRTMPVQEVVEMWQKGFEDLDAVNHLSGNHLVDIHEDSADVFTYGTATHYKKAAVEGKTREFVGSYDLHLIRTENGWRIDVFKYNLKYVNGNLEMR